MAHDSRSWDVLDALGPDLALLNEARAPEENGERILGGRRTLGRDGYKRPWAAAIDARYELCEIHDARATRYGRTIDVPLRTHAPALGSLQSPPYPDSAR
jgi:hypothetical protein